MKAQKTNFSHMVIYYVHPDSREMVLDASGMSVRVQEYKMFLKNNTIVKKIQMESVGKFDFCGFYIPLLGRSYDFKSIIGLAFKSLGLKRSNKIGRNRTKLICSELVALYLERFYGVEIVDSDNYGLNETQRVINDIYKR
tara:strand:- start:9864 stop:10283 length:420 start_codon:yes stop_codon:yes gene_type:complete